MYTVIIQYIDVLYRDTSSASASIRSIRIVRGLQEFKAGLAAEHPVFRSSRSSRAPAKSAKSRRNRVEYVEWTAPVESSRFGLAKTC